MSTMQANTRGRAPPPALPPRQSSSTMDMDEPPPYELVAQQQKAYEKAIAGSVASSSGAGLMQNDPRSSSQDSLVPEAREQGDRRRRLLMIYVHGFMGNETSFQSFPAHVHNLLAILLGETHVVHTKIYPRYRSKGNIGIARNDFSKWLEPHESSTTDVVFLGHSMGGLLSAEVALMPSPRPAAMPLKHRIVGTINFDVPFLGMHPGVVKSGLASIFTSDDKGNKPDGDSEAVERADTLWSKPDANYNPTFQNDVVLPVRKGWSSAWHFINKHSDDLYKSTKKLVSSHMEFGGAMANYGELKTRYVRLRALEEENSKVRESVVEAGVPPRVRFINYYTASTGRPKKPRSPRRRQSPESNGSQPSSRPSRSRASTTSLEDHAQTEKADGATGASSLEEDHRPKEVDTSHQQWENAMESLQIGDGPAQNSRNKAQTPNLLPAKPPAIGDLSYIQDSTIRNMVKQEHDKAMQRYEKALAEQAAASTILKSAEAEPQEQQPAQQPESEMTHGEKEALRLMKEKQRMEAEARRMRGENDPELALRQSDVNPSNHHNPENGSQAASRRPSTTRTTSTAASIATQDTGMLTPQASKASNTSASTKDTKPKKDRKFCTLPPKDSRGERDPCWVRVFMENVDEVGAHCGLFFVDERYERLVGDVADRIEGWVAEDLSVRYRTEKG